MQRFSSMHSVLVSAVCMHLLSYCSFACACNISISLPSQSHGSVACLQEPSFQESSAVEQPVASEEVVMEAPAGTQEVAREAPRTLNDDIPTSGLTATPQLGECGSCIVQV